MAIRTRTLFSLTAAVLLYIGLVSLAVGYIAATGIGDLERTEAEEALSRLSSEFAEMRASLAATARILGEWEETRAFIAGADDSYPALHLNPASLSGMNVDMAALFDRSGRLVHAAWRLPTGMPGGASAEEVAETFRRLGVRDETTGTLIMGGDVHLVAYAPLRNSGNMGSYRGGVLLLRRLDAAELQRISRRLAADVTIVPPLPGSPPAPSTPTVDVSGAWGLRALMPLEALGGGSAATASIELPREFYQRGRDLLAVGLLLLILSGFVFALALSWMVERAVFRRLRNIEVEVSSLGTDDGRLLDHEGEPDDEISLLTRKMNELLDAARAKTHALDESRTLFQGLFEKAAESIFLVEADGPEAGKILAANPEAARTHGYTLDELTGRSIVEVDALGTEELVAAMMERIRAGEWVRWEMNHRRKDGSEFPVEISAGLLELRGRRVILGFDRDITERRRFESQLRDARATAEEGSRLKSEFLSNVTHELRTPLNSILGYAELLSDGVDGPMNPRQLDSLERVQKNARLLLRLIEDILDFSRLESERMELDRHAFSLRETLGEAVRMLRLKAERKGVELAWSVAPEIPDLLMGDEKRLGQVVVNLLDNAVKFTEKGSVSIDAALEEQADDTFGVRIAVTDTGIGIAQEALPHIFEAFVQADGSTSRRYGGSGLGLAIVARLVEKMGGSIAVESQEHRGSRFTVRLAFSRSFAG